MSAPHPSRALRLGLVAMSAFAVVSDAVLIAFYPQFFALRYGVTSPLHVGAYIAAISIAVMFTLPVWARIARRVETMPLLAVTQCAAGLLCLASAWAPSVLAYWVLTMAMFMVKSSYLLLYPYLLGLEAPEAHRHTIGLLSVVVYLGGIVGAVAGGWLLRAVGTEACIALMAAGDFAQMAIGLALLAGGRAVSTLERDRAQAVETADASAGRLPRILALSFVVLVFDFAAYLVRPFFSVYWEAVSPGSPAARTGMVFAMPAAVALVALIVNRCSARRFDHVLANLLLGAVGLFLQAAPAAPLILLGRIVYGWALFQLIVKFEVLLFALSAPRRYARDFSLFNFFQNLGVLLSSFAAGALVAHVGIGLTFAMAAAGFLLTAALHHVLVSRSLPTPLAALPAARHAH